MPGLFFWLDHAAILVGCLFCGRSRAGTSAGTTIAAYPTCAGIITLHASFVPHATSHVRANILRYQYRGRVLCLPRGA
jgi:hypothetical protein